MGVVRETKEDTQAEFITLVVYTPSAEKQRRRKQTRSKTKGSEIASPTHASRVQQQRRYGHIALGQPVETNPRNRLQEPHHPKASIPATFTGAPLPRACEGSRIVTSPLLDFAQSSTNHCISWASHVPPSCMSYVRGGTTTVIRRIEGERCCWGPAS